MGRAAAQATTVTLNKGEDCSCGTATYLSIPNSFLQHLALLLLPVQAREVMPASQYPSDKVDVLDDKGEG